jgi:hypothetical protein
MRRGHEVSGSNVFKAWLPFISLFVNFFHVLLT